MVARVDWSKPGTPGLPTDTDMMLMIPKQMQASGQKVTYEKDANVACFGMVILRIQSSTCGNVHGYLLFAVARKGPMVPFTALRTLLAAAMSKL